MITSIFLVVSAGMMPSQATGVMHAFELGFGADGVDELDFPADPFAGGVGRCEGRIGFRRHADLDRLGTGAAPRRPVRAHSAAAAIHQFLHRSMLPFVVVRVSRLRPTSVDVAEELLQALRFRRAEDLLRAALLPRPARCRGRRHGSRPARANFISWVTSIMVRPSRARSAMTFSTSPTSSGRAPRSARRTA